MDSLDKHTRYQMHDKGYGSKKQQAATSRHARSGVIISVVVGIIVVAVLFGLWLFIDSTKSVNNYVEAVNNQYQAVANNQNLDEENVSLKSVWLGDLINPKYKKIKEIDNDYQNLINALRNYTVIMEQHNQLVTKFNAGIQGDEVLSSDILNLVNKMTELVQQNYPDKQAELAALQALGQKITESTNFVDISGEVSDVLHVNDTWLNAERDSIEQRREQFQNAINAI